MKDLSEKFMKKKENELKSLENKKEIREIEIKNQEELLRQNNSILDKLKYENSLLKDKYNSLKRVIKERGLMIDIINDNYIIREWDNLSLNKEGNILIVYSKRGDRIKELDKDTSEILEEIIREEGRYSLVVIRVDSKHIKAMARFN